MYYGNNEANCNECLVFTKHIANRNGIPFFLSNFVERLSSSVDCFSRLEHFLFGNRRGVTFFLNAKRSQHRCFG